MLRIVQIWPRLAASSSRHPGLSNGVRHAFYNKGYREQCSEQVPKWAEIAAAAAGKALQHERCVSILIEPITSGEHGGPAKVSNAAQRAFRSLLVKKSSMPALPVHRRIGSIGGSGERDSPNASIGTAIGQACFRVTSATLSSACCRNSVVQVCLTPAGDTSCVCSASTKQSGGANGSISAKVMPSPLL